MTRPSILFISIDALRFDCPSYQPCTAYLDRFGIQKTSFMPTFDRLAEASVRFTEAVSTATYTTSAHASVFTGLEPPQHGVRAFFKTALRRDVPTLAEMLHASGYHCLMATDVPELFGPLGLTRGFDEVFSADDTRLLKALDRAPRPTFAFLHLFDVHDPYRWTEAPEWQTPREYEAGLSDIARCFDVPVPPGSAVAQWRELIRSLPGGKAAANAFLPLYLEGTGAFDRGRFSHLVSNLERRGLLGEDAVTFIFADHGEGDNYGHFTHGGPLLDEVLRVPLIIHAPGRLAPRNVSHQVSLTSLARTVLDLAEVEPKCPEPRMDDSLLPLARGETPGRFSVAYSENWSGNRAIDLDELRGGQAAGIEWMLVERAVRIPGYKLRVRGSRPPVLHACMPAGLSDQEYVAELYRQILGRDPDAAGLTTYVQALQSVAITRSGVERAFLDSEEFARGRLTFFNLRDTPCEDVVSPVVSQSAPFSLRDGWMWCELERRSQPGLEGPPVFEEPSVAAYSAEDEAMVYKRLEQLGYVE
jgi:arylsulfatase